MLVQSPLLSSESGGSGRSFFSQRLSGGAKVSVHTFQARTQGASKSRALWEGAWKARASAMGKKNASKDNGKAKPRDPPPPNPKVLRSSGGSKPAVWLVAPAMIALLAAGVAYVGWPQGAPPHATLHQQNVTSAVESAASAAASASSAELPRGWGSAMDPSSGKPYYYKLATRESTWERPTEPCDDESVVASAEQQQQQLGKEGEDVHEHCGYWAAAGECASNPSFMEQQCKTSCAHTAAALKSGKAARGLASGKARGHPTTHTTHTTHTTPQPGAPPCPGLRHGPHGAA